MIQAIFCFSRHGKIRLKRWFTSAYDSKEKQKLINNITTTVLHRKPTMCNVLEFGEKKVIYRRYASLYFAVIADWDENELITLQVIHSLVEGFDRLFQNVCELDIIFNYEQAYAVLDEILIAGHMQDSSIKAGIKHIAAMNLLVQEDAQGEPLKVSDSLAKTPKRDFV